MRCRANDATVCEEVAVELSAMSGSCEMFKLCLDAGCLAMLMQVMHQLMYKTSNPRLFRSLLLSLP